MTEPDNDLHFLTIDVRRHAELCVALRRDSFVCSFGSDERFVRENGENGERYVAWLETSIAKFPTGFVHVWRNGEIIGQMEMQIRDDPPSGYVNLFYLIPSARGSGAGRALQEYALRWFRDAGVAVARLSVSPSNGRAVAYYEKHGWRDLGPRPGNPEVHLMELGL